MLIGEEHFAPIYSGDEEEVEEVCPFQGKGDVFSNFFPCKVHIFGMSFKSAEHAYQFKKAVDCGYSSAAREIKDAVDGPGAKMVAKRVTPDSDWSISKIPVMRSIVRAKAESCLLFRRALLDSQGLLVEAVPGDRFWSSGLDRQAVRSVSKSQWPGANRLGLLLGELRQDLRNIEGFGSTGQFRAASETIQEGLPMVGEPLGNKRVGSPIGVGNRKRRKRSCPVSGCSWGSGANVKKHVTRSHLPRFLLKLGGDELSVASRVHQLDVLFDFVLVSLHFIDLGGLITWMDEGGLWWTLTELQYTEEELQVFEAWQVGYPHLVSEKLKELCHWRNLCVLSNQLTESQRVSFPNLSPVREGDDRLLDAHCHLDMVCARARLNSFSQVTRKYPLRDSEQCVQGGVACFCYPSHWGKDVLKGSSGNWKLAYGFHPHLVGRAPFDLDVFRGLLDQPGVVGLGEVGIDYTSIGVSVSDQVVFLRQLLPLTVEKKLPLIIHCRDRPGGNSAYQHCFEILSEGLPHFTRVYLHCFAGSAEVSQKFMETFPNLVFGVAPKFSNSEVLKGIPLARMLLETDAPYFPQGSRIGLPRDVGEVARWVSFRKGVGLEEVLVTVNRTFKRVFGFC